jgi:TnpA family transposase
VLERLAASSDRPARALTMLGRIVKTIYILRYLEHLARWLRSRVPLRRDLSALLKRIEPAAA